MVLFAVLVRDGTFDRVRANAFQSMLPSSDNLVRLHKYLVVFHLILQSKNKVTIQIVSR